MGFLRTMLRLCATAFSAASCAPLPAMSPTDPIKTKTRWRAQVTIGLLGSLRSSPRFTHNLRSNQSPVLGGSSGGGHNRAAETQRKRSLCNGCVVGSTELKVAARLNSKPREMKSARQKAEPSGFSPHGSAVCSFAAFFNRDVVFAAMRAFLGPARTERASY